MSTTAGFEDPTTVQELTRYVEREHPNLDPSYDSGLDQLDTNPREREQRHFNPVLGFLTAST